MIDSLRQISNFYEEFISSGDPRVTKWFLMEGPESTLILVFLYVVFAKIIGPMWMMDRKPFDLRIPMFLYNITLVLGNICLAVQAIILLISSRNKGLCRKEFPTDPTEMKLAELGWWFFFLKFVEFLDTVFFVLRKKFQHISTLHLVHHSIVPIAVWGGLRVEPASYNYFFPLLNTTVHIVMYLYYGLSALGPNIQKYLWWKKYLTAFQMIQFVMVFLYIVLLVLSNCQVSKFVILVNTMMAGLFLIMFFDYFRNSYMKSGAIKMSSNGFRDTKQDVGTDISNKQQISSFNKRICEQSQDEKKIT